MRKLIDAAMSVAIAGRAPTINLILLMIAATICYVIARRMGG